MLAYMPYMDPMGTETAFLRVLGGSGYPFVPLVCFDHIPWLCRWKCLCLPDAGAKGAESSGWSTGFSRRTRAGLPKFFPMDQPSIHSKIINDLPLPNIAHDGSMVLVD